MSWARIFKHGLQTPVFQLARRPGRLWTRQGLGSSCLRSQARQYGASAPGEAEIGGSARPGGSRLRKAIAWGANGFVFATTGFLVALYTTMPASILGLNFLSDEDSRSAYSPGDDETRRIEDHVNTHPFVARIRQTPGMGESRPHMKMPLAFRKQSLTAGVLQGPRKLSVPPYTWRDGEGKSLVSVCYIGPDLCGHPGIVHGGLLATLLDEGLAGCCFEALPHKIGVTAKLDVNYRSPARAGGFFVLRANTTKVEGRKAWVEGRIETLEPDGKKPTVIVEATALFVSPRNAGMMPKIHSA